MSGRISIINIKNSIHEGLIKAQNFSYQFSGYWLWNSPEYLINIFIAKEISNLEGAKWITLENSN